MVQFISVSNAHVKETQMWKPSDTEKDKLREFYEDCSVAVDQLPYTEEFEQLFQKLGIDVSRNELFRVLGNMRKRRELPKKPR